MSKRNPKREEEAGKKRENKRLTYAIGMVPRRERDRKYCIADFITQHKKLRQMEKCECKKAPRNTYRGKWKHTQVQRKC